MIKEIINTVGNFLFGGDLTELQKSVKDFDLCKSNEKELHKFYDEVISPCENQTLKEIWENKHFEDLFNLSKSKKETEVRFFESVSKRIESIMKGEKQYGYTEKMKKSLGKKRHQMPQVDSDNITDFVLHFKDKVGVKKVKRKLSNLKPSQDELNNEKIDSIIDGYSKNENKNVYIISNDNYILDGHHRWAADLELKDNSEKVECYRIDLPALDLIKRANQLKITKQVDIDDETFKKAIVLISKAKDEGFLSEDLLNLVKAKTDGLIPVTRTVIRNGKRHAQIFWVSPESANLKRKTPKIVEETDLSIQSKNDLGVENQNRNKNEELFKRQKIDDSITNVGDKVNVKYIGNISKEKFDFKNLEVVSISDDSIKCVIPETIYTDKKFPDNQKIIFRKGAIIEIPKHNNRKWGIDNNYELLISEDERKSRLQRLNILQEIRNIATEAKKKGYSVFEDSLTMSEEQIRAKYAPFFAKYGNTFDPIKMFDETTKHIKEHFNKNEVNVFSTFTTDGFRISVKDKESGISLMDTQRSFQNGDSNLPPERNKGIYHAYFAIHQRKHQGGGLAKKLFCEYYDQYKKMGLDHLAVGPGLSSGPYVWPSYAFYSRPKLADRVLRYFAVGEGRIIKKQFVDTIPGVESVKVEGRRIFIKYEDAEHEIDVTDEKDYSQENQALVDKLQKEYQDVTNTVMEINARTLEDNIGNDDYLTEDEAQKLLQPLTNRLTEINAEIDSIPFEKKYSIDSEGVILNKGTVKHTITQEEHDEANRVYAIWKENNPNASLFKSTIWTSNKILRNAAKVAYLNAQGSTAYGHHVVDLKNDSHRLDFEKQIGYDIYLKNKENAKSKG